MSDQMGADQCQTKPALCYKFLNARLVGYLIVAGTALGCFFSRLNVYSSAMQRSAWEAAILVGSEVGATVTTILLVVMIPRMIMTWITALVFEFVFERLRGHREEVIRDGRKMARELSIGTLKQILTEGNFIAFGVALLYLIFSFFTKRSFGEFFARAR